ncbi:MAG: hypothetical protein VYC76_05520, partial [Pseudomonadota bacterium]|nr:hypothetical protein [Pseudomonadota bacterium]
PRLFGTSICGAPPPDSWGGGRFFHPVFIDNLILLVYGLVEGDEKRDKYLFPHVFLYLRLAQRSFYAYKEPLNVA